MSRFRPKYRELTIDEQEAVADYKSFAEDLDMLIAPVIETGRGAREAALARTKLEESVMWFTKAVTG